MSLPSVVAEAAGPREGRRGNALRLLAITLLTLFCVGAARAPTVAQPAPVAAEAAPGDAQSGSLMLRNGERYVEAVRLGTDVELVVSGPTVRARVTQAFRNTTSGWVEAVYVYPLPEDGAVDSLKMVVGNRVVVGEIKPREEALAVYEAAREEGLAAALVEQERPNLFTNSIANIGPGETVVVQIEYQAPVARSGDVYSLRVPLVSGVRYTPGPRDGHDPVPDRHRIDSPVLDPRVHGRTNPVTLTVRLQPGFELGVVKSAYHAVDSPPRRRRPGRHPAGSCPSRPRLRADLAPGRRRCARRRPLHERVAGKDYVLAYVTPPSFRRPGPPPAREIVFVIDNSGSMDGESMPQAKASLDFALRRLRPGDRFNVVRFDDTLQVLYPDTVPADAAHLAQARAFVAGLEAQGGTEMLPALKAALADRRPGDTRFLRQVVFLTDGQIGDEAELLEAMGAGRGRSRVFMVGIGSAPNSYLMSRAAEIGRGAFTHIGSPEEVEADMRALFEKLERPGRGGPRGLSSTA
jgi:Ca-activated chloride channel family protein